VAYFKDYIQRPDEHSGFEVFTAVVMNVAIFWYIALCSPCLNRRFGGAYRLHLQGKKSADCLPPAVLCFLTRLIFYPEDGGDISFEMTVHVRTTRVYVPEDYDSHAITIWNMELSILGIKVGRAT
jgi:hypothetical protein